MDGSCAQRVLSPEGPWRELSLEDANLVLDVGPPWLLPTDVTPSKWLPASLQLFPVDPA